MPENQATPAGNGKNLAWAHRLSTFLLAAAFLSTFAAVAAKSDSGWPEASLLVLATISTIIALARQLPLQNVLLAALVTALIGGAAHALGATTEIPFGPFTFGPDIGPQLFKTLPWAMPLLWVAVILNSRGVGRLILRPWRKTRAYGFWLIGLTTALTVVFNLAFDPFAARVKHYWIWTPTKFPLTWQGAPPTDFIAWGTVALLILAFITPALINKQLSRRSSPDFHPLAVWLGAILLFGTAASLRGLWPSVGADAIIFAVAAVFAIRGAKW
jgi:uncharacterized membrane protein